MSFNNENNKIILTQKKSEITVDYFKPQLLFQKNLLKSQRRKNMKCLILSSQSAIGQYEEVLPSLHFSGPTQLAPMLEKAAALAESQNMSQNKQVYTVLLVITVSIYRFFMSFFS